MDLHSGAVQLCLENALCHQAFPALRPTPAAVCASIGPTGRPTRRVNASSAAVPPVNAAAATAGRSPPSIAARRTAARGNLRGLRRPRRPSRRPARLGAARRSAGAAETSARLRLRDENNSATSSARRACEPLPATAPIAEKVASTPTTVRLGCAAAGGNDRKAAQPTPIWRCGSSPESHATTIATSAGSDLAWPSSSAIRAILASREAEPPTSTEVVATSISSTAHLYTPDRQRHARPR